MTKIKKISWLKQKLNSLNAWFLNLFIDPKPMFPEFKGTKGKWITRNKVSCETSIYTETHRVAEAKHYTGQIDPGFLEPTEEEGGANARLIANSPELLEALQALLVSYSMANVLRAYKVITNIHES